MKNLSQTIKSTIVSLILVGGISYAFAWSGPSNNPPDNGSINAPISTGSIGQTKTSWFASTELLASVDVTSPKFCIGSDCIISWSNVGGGNPSGAIMAFNLSSCPSGWKIADGTNGTPDLRGYFIRGLNTSSSGIDPNRILGSIQADDLKAHTHTGTTDPAGAHTHSASVPGFKETGVGNTSGNDTYGFTGQNYLAPSVSVAAVGDHTHTFTTDSRGGTETRPKNIALFYCQKI